MANYDIPQYPTKRLRYFNNQFLSDQDFIDDDAARIGHERAFLRSLCVAGVCEGLQVTYPAANLPPSVSAGIAIDKTGRMIVVDHATDAVAKPDALADGDYFIHISFVEIEDVKASGQGASDFTRWKQTPVINATAKSVALPDGVVVLGSCTVKNKAFVGSGTTIGRQYSGLRLPGPNQAAAATLRNNGAADDLAVLAGSLTIRRDVRAQLGPTLTLSNPTGGLGAGGAIDFNGCDPGTYDPTLRVRSLDDGNYSSHLTFATKQPGAVDHNLVERLRLTSDGLLQFPNEAPKDKIVVWDGGTTDRFGIGLNGSNISLFYPTSARFSLRQNSSTGTEVFSVDGSGAVTLSGPIQNSLTIHRDIAGQLGPKLTLQNSAGTSGAGGAIDFNGYDPGTNDPSLRVQSLDDGHSSSHLTFSTKQSGDNTHKLVERLRLTSDGLLQFPNEAPKDKIVVWDGGTTDRFGIGLNGSNINLFCPTNAHFSLRQNSCSGTEVFSVKSDGTATFSGPIVPKVGNDASSGIQFPKSSDGSDYAFLRYYFPTGETGKLVLGIEDNSNDALVLWQGGAERLTIANNLVSVANSLSVAGVVSWGDIDTRTETRNDAGLQGNAGARSGFFQTSTPVNFPQGATSWWHLLDVRHSNPANNFALQIAGSFSDQNLWFRKTNDNPATTWRQFVSADASGNVSAAGNMQVAKRLTANGALTFGMSTWESYQADSTVVTDNVNYKAMMIVGSNQNQGHNRWIRMWDDVQVEGSLTVGTKVRMYYYDLPATDTNTGRPTTTPALGITLPNCTHYLWLAGWQLSSDAALKTDVVAYEPVLDRVMQLRPVRFKWKADGSDGSGFIAQEVEALFPDLVHEGLAGEAMNRPMKSIGYDRFGMLAVAAIKELKTVYDARLDALERRLATLEGKS